MFHRIGAVLFIIWGLLHLYAAYTLYLFGTTLETGMVQGRIIQNAWHLLFFGVVAIVIGALCNWKNSRTGYWTNITVLTVVDIGFITFVLLPYLPLMSPAILGPVFWVVAVIFATLGYLKEETTP